MKLTSSITFLLISSVTFSQFTKGGSEKNYERNKISYDSVVTEKQIPIGERSNSMYVAYTASFVKSTDDHSRSSMTQQEYFNSPYYGAPYNTGKMGLKNGFAFSVNFQTPINAINRNLIRNIDFGLNWKLGFTSLSYDWRSMYENQNLIFYNIFEDAKYSSFKVVNFGVGPSITIIHDPKKPLFFVDAYFRFNANIIFGGGIESVFQDGSTEYELSTYMEGATFRMSPTIGANVRLRNFMVFIENNLGLAVQNNSNSTSFFEGYSVDTYDSFDYVSNTVKVSNLFRLSNLQFGLGYVF